MVKGTISHYLVAHISLSHFLHWNLLLTEKARCEVVEDILVICDGCWDDV